MRSISFIEMYYCIILVFIFSFFYMHFKYNNNYIQYGIERGYKNKINEYDCKETIKRLKILHLLTILYSTIIVLFAYIYGEFLVKYSLILLAILYFLGGIWVGPVKKNNVKNKKME